MIKRWVIFYILIAVICTSAYGEMKYLVETSKDLKEQGRSYAASFYLKEYLKTNKNKSKFHQNYEYLLNLIDLVGYGIFDDLSLFDNKSYPFAALYYHAFKAKVFKKQYNKAYLSFDKFPANYKENPVFLQLYGFSAYMIGEHDKAETSFRRCLSKAKNAESPHFMSDKNFTLILEQCRLYLARTLYKKKKFEQSLMHYSKIDKDSNYYPLIFTEKAWAYYHLAQYESVLGINIAFRSSWLNAFYDGEIDFLGALSLMRLCRWNDVFSFFTQLHQKGNLMIVNISKVEYFLEHNFLKYLANLKVPNNNLTRVQEQILVRFQLSSYWKRIYSQYKQLQNELNLSRNIPVDQVDGKRLNHFYKIKLASITQDIKLHLLGELSKYRLLLYSMKERADSLELEILSRYRNTVNNEDNNLKSLKSKKNKKIEIAEESTIKTWTFTKEYWRDELGSYKIKVPSMCESNLKELEL